MLTKVSNCNLCVYDSSFVCIVSLSSLSLSSEKKKKNKAKTTPQPTTGPYVWRKRLYYNAEKEIPVFKGDVVEDPQYYLIGASGVKEILFANMDEDVKGTGPGIHGCTPEGRHCIRDIDDTSIIVLGRKVTYAEMMSAIPTTPKSPATPVCDDDFGIEGDDEEVGKA